MSDQKTGISLSDGTYDKAKFVVQIVMPALGVLYASLALFWGFPKVEEVVGSITAIALFLGVVLRISSNNYTGEGVPVGDYVVGNDGNGTTTVRLDLDKNPDEFLNNERITFRYKEEVTSSDDEIRE